MLKVIELRNTYEMVPDARVTIALMTFNRATFLPSMIESILNQSYRDFVLKIYDNCSTDKTADVVHPFLADRRVSYIQGDRNIGAWANFNRAIDECSTDFLLITHDDDVMHRDMVRQEFQTLEHEPGLGMVCVNVDYIDSRGFVTVSRVYDSQTNGGDIYIEKNQFVERFVRQGNLINCPTAMFRVRILHHSGIRFRSDVGSAIDAFLWFELNAVAPFKYISEPLYFYRIHDGQDSRNHLQMRPMLKVPVYRFLLSNGFPASVIKLWLKSSNRHIMELSQSGLSVGDLQMLKKKALVGASDSFLFRLWLRTYPILDPIFQLVASFREFAWQLRQRIKSFG